MIMGVPLLFVLTVRVKDTTNVEKALLQLSPINYRVEKQQQLLNLQS